MTTATWILLLVGSSTLAFLAGGLCGFLQRNELRAEIALLKASRTPTPELSTHFKPRHRPADPEPLRAALNTRADRWAHIADGLGEEAESA